MAGPRENPYTLGGKPLIIRAGVDQTVAALHLFRGK
ncbi:hypothetical protein XSR1_20209 [Xenorhabdus szentirmaii DSM 16338]|uniref:Uncharacterized protein n=1 Tax=Xenorhabdus szentirmaii DSM 16338 TaxID=1427518 RepID=W1IXQ8_9GAMM|nr:hypothetical protein XSR1_20209 [Xenorhabdus szentirmaii DSM 16338]